MRISDWSSYVCSSDLAAGPADARQIVAQEIYDHEVLGAILAAFGQFSRVAPVTGRIGAPRPGALPRPYVDPPVGERKEKFGCASQQTDYVVKYEGGSTCLRFGPERPLMSVGTVSPTTSNGQLGQTR